MNHSLPIQPFTAARLERASEGERNTELAKLGIRFLKANNLMAWDGRDYDRALDLATISYKQVIWRINNARPA